MGTDNGSSRLSYHLAYGALLDGGTFFTPLIPLFPYGFYFTMLFRDGIIDCQIIKKEMLPSAVFDFIFDAKSCATGSFVDHVSPTPARIIHASSSDCEQSGPGSTGLFHATSCVWWKDVTKLDTNDPTLFASTTTELYESFDFFLTSGGRRLNLANFTPPPSAPSFSLPLSPLLAANPISTASHVKPPPPSQPPPSPQPSNTCQNMESHSQTQSGVGSPNFAFGIGQSFSINLWFSAADLHLLSAQTYPHDAAPYSSMPLSPRQTAIRHQYTMFAISEDNAIAPWSADQDYEDGLLGRVCADRTQSQHGLGIALVMNDCGCPQLIFGQKSSKEPSPPQLPSTSPPTPPPPPPADGAELAVLENPGKLGNEVADMCLAIPSNHLHGGCFTVNPCSAREYRLNDPLHNPKAFFNTSLAASFNADMANAPRKQHSITFSVNELSRSSKTYNASDRQKWAIYIDGHLYAASNWLGKAVDNGGEDTFAVQSQEINERFYPRSAPRLDEIITPTMKLKIGSDTYQYDKWSVPNFPPFDIADLYPTNIPTTDKRFVWQRPPLHNAHPFRGAVERVTLYASALTADQVAKMHAEGLPNAAPVITSGPILHGVEDNCTLLALSATDDDNNRFGANQTISFLLISSTYDLYTDATCSEVATVGDAHLQLFTQAPTDFSGRFDTSVAAFDGVAQSNVQAIRVLVTGVADGPDIMNATFEVGSDSFVEISLEAYDPDTQSPSLAFRVELLSLPLLGTLYSANCQTTPSCTALSVLDMLPSSSTFWYKNPTFTTGTTRIVNTDLFTVRGVRALPDATTSDDITVISVNHLNALQPITRSVNGSEGAPFNLTLRATATPGANVTFHIVKYTGLVIAATTASSYDCGDFLCGMFEASLNYSSQSVPYTSHFDASVAYTVMATDNTNGNSHVQNVEVVILNQISPTTFTLQSPNVSVNSDDVRPFANASFNDPDKGFGFLYVSLSTTNFRFSVDQSLEAGFEEPPSTELYHVLREQAYDLAGECPSACETSRSYSINANLGYRCDECLIPPISKITTFKAVMHPNALSAVLKSVVFDKYSLSATRLNDVLTVGIVKYADGNEVAMNATQIPMELYIVPYHPTYAVDGVCYAWEGYETSKYFFEMFLCILLNFQGPFWYYLFSDEKASKWGVTSYTVGAIWAGVAILLLVACVACGFMVAAVRFSQYVIVTLVKLRQFLNRDEEKQRGERLEQPFLCFSLQWLTCYGCCGIFASFCAPKRANDPTYLESIKRFLFIITCGLIKRFDSHPDKIRPTLVYRLRNLGSWILCRGCYGIIPKLAKPKPYTKIMSTDKEHDNGDLPPLFMQSK